MATSIPSAIGQASATAWAGEWGTFARIPAAGHIAEHYEGVGLSITACSARQCHFSFEILGPTFHGEAQGDLLAESDSEAVAHLSYGTEYNCTLALQKSASDQPSILATHRDGDCSPFLTPGATFEHTYPLRSRTPFFFTDDLPACFVAKSRAWVTLCASQTLSQQEHDWMLLVWDVSDLVSHPGEPRLDLPADRASILQSCDAAPDPGACLASAFAQSFAELNARKEAWKASVTEPGDPSEATRAIAAITGIYRHSFPNGDVQGDTFQSTDILEIQPVSGTSIHVAVHLEFFNGHECNHQGVAGYRRSGIFAEQLRDGQGKLCVFEVVPTGTGVQLADPTGMCRMMDCGARGGYNGAAFSFDERVQPAPPPQKPATRP